VSGGGRNVEEVEPSVLDIGSAVCMRMVQMLSFLREQIRAGCWLRAATLLLYQHLQNRQASLLLPIVTASSYVQNHRTGAVQLYLPCREPPHKKIDHVLRAAVRLALTSRLSMLMLLRRGMTSNEQSCSLTSLMSTVGTRAHTPRDMSSTCKLLLLHEQQQSQGRIQKRTCLGAAHG
jgi:hypothetical protein